jgi:hypothetical protein
MKLIAKTTEGKTVTFPSWTDMTEARKLNPTLVGWDYVI